MQDVRCVSYCSMVKGPKYHFFVLHLLTYPIDFQYTPFDGTKSDEVWSPPLFSPNIVCGVHLLTFSVMIGWVWFVCNSSFGFVRERPERPKAPSPGQAKRHPGYAYWSSRALKGQKL